jgi:hypothetical protein
MNWKTWLGLSSTPLSGEEVHEIESAQQIQLERNGWQIALVISIFFVALPLPLIWLVTNQAIKAAYTGEPLPGGWTWLSVIGFDILVVLVSIYLAWSPVKDMLTLFTEQGIRQPSWFGLRYAYLKWSQVEHIDNKYPVIRLIAPNQIIRLNLVLFKHPETVINEIGKHVPNSSL